MATTQERARALAHCAGSTSTLVGVLRRKIGRLSLEDAEDAAQHGIMAMFIKYEQSEIGIDAQDEMGVRRVLWAYAERSAYREAIKVLKKRQSSKSHNLAAQFLKRSECTESVERLSEIVQICGTVELQKWWSCILALHAEGFQQGERERAEELGRRNGTSIQTAYRRISSLRTLFLTELQKPDGTTDS